MTKGADSLDSVNVDDLVNTGLSTDPVNRLDEPSGKRQAVVRLTDRPKTDAQYLEQSTCHDGGEVHPIRRVVAATPHQPSSDESEPDSTDSEDGYDGPKRRTGKLPPCIVPSLPSDRAVASYKGKQKSSLPHHDRDAPGKRLWKRSRSEPWRIAVVDKKTPTKQPLKRASPSPSLLPPPVKRVREQTSLKNVDKFPLINQSTSMKLMAALATPSKLSLRYGLTSFLYS